MKRCFLSIFIALIGCSNLPPAIQNAPSVEIGYRQVKTNSDRFTGSPVRWGGTIIDVENEEEYSHLQVLYYPLNSYGRPRLSQPSEGRFIMRTEKLLDPEVYSKGSEITVAGRLTGQIDQKVGNKSVQLPLISNAETYLWPVYQRPRYHGGYYGAYWGYPYFGFSRRYGYLFRSGFYGCGCC